MKKEYGFNDHNIKRKKPIYYIISDFDGKLIEEFPAGSQSQWDGGFDEYQGEYVLIIKVNNFSNTLNNMIFMHKFNERVLEDLQNNKVKLCFYAEEGGAQDSVLNVGLYKFLSEQLVSANIDEKNIFYSDSNLIIESEFKKHYPNSKINVFSHYWQCWRYLYSQNKILSVDDFLKTKSVNRDKHFLSYNRSPHTHRCATIVDIFENKLHEKSILSFPSELEGVQGNKFSIQNEVDKFYTQDNYKSELINDLHNHLPFIADVKNIFTEDNVWDSVVIESSFFNTYFSLVVGTMFEDYEEENPYTIFMSEKIYKALTSFHPTIYMGNMGSLKKLKEMGFKTFHPFIDESYDKEPNRVKRFEMIMKEVNKLCNMKLSELHDLYWSMSDVLIHNHNVYYNKVVPFCEDKMEHITQEIMK